MRSQLRLTVLVPLALLGLLGAGFGAFALAGPPNTAQPPLAAASPGTVTTAETATAEAPAEPAKKPKKKQKQTKAAAGGTPLERALAKNRVVVVLFYAPGAAYDTIQTRETRAGAHAAGAGFLALDVSEDGQIVPLATEYEVRTAPATLVFARGPRVAVRIDGYADRDTVEQAAVNARRS